MHIGFDVTPLCVPHSGVGTYTANLLEHLRRNSPGEIIPLAHRRLAEGGGRSLISVNKTFWMQAVLPWVLLRLGVDVCHFTNGVASLWTPCPTVVTVHDMTLWLFPQHHYRRRLLAMRPFIPLAAHRATAIIAVSHSAKADIGRILGVPAEKVTVIYEAPGPAFRPLALGSVLESVRQRYRLPERFLLYVGTIEPRKNLVRLLEAFACLRLTGTIPHGLVFVGQRGWKYAPVFAAVERLGLSDAVRFLGYVPTMDLVALYNLADALVFPSLYEGFGLPVVEAMACGTPVVTSPNGSLGEVAGDAALFVEPTRVESIAEGLRQVVQDRTRREELRARGLARAARFTWAQAADETRQVYAEAVKAGSRRTGLAAAPRDGTACWPGV